MTIHSLRYLGLIALSLQVAIAKDAPLTSPALGAKVPAFAMQVVASRDNQDLPFLLVDKTQASVWLYTAKGALIGKSAVLVGLAIGDISVAGIGERKLSSIRPDERITPAGRFPSMLGYNLKGQEVLWVDYAGGVSLHRIVKGTTAERRAERMSTPTPTDNHISYGCINVPTVFFNALILPIVRERGAMVYVLPEKLSLGEVFDFAQGGSVR